jgi:hypothetical protein
VTSKRIKISKLFHRKVPRLKGKAMQNAKFEKFDQNK